MSAKKKRSSWTLGADPELLLADTRTGACAAVEDLVTGTKDKPEKLVDMGRGFAIQADNVALEFNIPPAKSWEAFHNHINSAVEYCANLVRNRSEGRVELSAAAERLYMQSALTHPNSQMFGCSPEFDAYTSERVAVPDREALVDKTTGGEWRFGGGHVHIGIDRSEEIPPHVMAQFADLFLGLRSLGYDKQPQRRKFYGQAGRFRPTKYGFEYRVLSNNWVVNPEIGQQVAYQSAHLAGFLARRPIPELQRLTREIAWGDVANFINEENEQRATDLVSYIYDELKVRELLG